MKKILIISNDDPVWLIPSWKKVIRKHSKNLDFLGIVYLPEKLKNFNFFQSIVYYLKTFGVIEFILLSLFGVKRIIKNKFNRVLEYENIDKIHLKNFSVEKIKQLIYEKEPEIIFITCSYIIPKELISIKKEIIWVNKHASLLPQTRGIFPYVWNVILERKQGLTFHEVNEKIDSGNIIYQEEIKNTSSMTDFYRTIYDKFDNYFEFFLEAYDIKFKSQEIEEEYYSLPTKEDIKIFKNKGGKIINLKDLL